MYMSCIMTIKKKQKDIIKQSYKPNKLTEKILRESECGENIESHNTIEDFWKSMGIDPNAQD